MAKIKKFKSGKIKRHKFKKKLGLKQGFGKPWSAPSISFRVEFRWEDEFGNEENDQIHWIDCRKFQGAEREFLKIHYRQSSEEWTTRETIESKFVCFYCVNFLIENKEKLHLNEAFIYSCPKKGSDTILSDKRGLPLKRS
jgi:hypothetical protein